MKKIKILTLALLVIATSCKKGFLDLNENPNYPSSVPASTLLASAQFKTASSLVSTSLSGPAIWMGYIAYSPNYAIQVESRNYVVQSTSGAMTYFNSLFTTAYDYNKMTNFATAQGNNALAGIGKIMKDFTMQNLVDMYGDVPYSQAFLETQNLKPAYDNGQAIYDSIYNDLGKAIVLINSALASDFPTKLEDLMYGSSSSQAAMWVKLANTIRLRILIRQSTTTGRSAYVASKIATDFPSGLASFIQAGEGAGINPGYTNSENQQNPFWANYGYTVAAADANPSLVAGNYAVNFYTSQNDWRAFYMYKPISNGSFNGSTFNGNLMGVQGATSPGFSKLVNAGAVTSSNNPDEYRAVSESQLILSDFESLFLQAEAVQRGWFAGSASALYNSAVKQSFIRCFGATNGPTKYAALTPTVDNNWTMATDKIKLIISQKYAALNTINYLEPWTEYRRTGFPAVPLSTSPTNVNHIPYRYLYPQSEINVNSTNVPVQTAATAQTSKIWWML